MSTNLWAILILAFLAGLCLGILFSSGRKWRRRYYEESALRKEEIRRRELLETERTQWERDRLAWERDQDVVTPRSRPIA